MAPLMHSNLAVSFLLGCHVAATDDAFSAVLAVLNFGAWAFLIFAFRRDLFGVR